MVILGPSWGSRGEQSGLSHNNWIKVELRDWEGIDKLVDGWEMSNVSIKVQDSIGLLLLLAECRQDDQLSTKQL